MAGAATSRDAHGGTEPVQVGRGGEVGEGGGCAGLGEEFAPNSTGVGKPLEGVKRKGVSVLRFLKVVNI